MNSGGLEISVVSKALGSKWDGLSPHLIARFYEVAQLEVGGPWVDAGKGVTVRAPLTEATLDATLNWQSPFEQTGPESSLPAIMALLQSGSLAPMLDTAGEALGAAADKTGLTKVADSIRGGTDRAMAVARGLEGRSGMTRLNSMQVFAGMPPIKMQVTALFRAWSDPAIEVDGPFNQLMSWALPAKLSELGPLLVRAADYAVSDSMSLTDVLAPSMAPTKIGMTYKGKTYAPLVIEAIGQPINSPVDSSGKYVELLVPMTLCTLTALDRDDWKRVNGG